MTLTRIKKWRLSEKDFLLLSFRKNLSSTSKNHGQRLSSLRCMEGWWALTSSVPDFSHCGNQLGDWIVFTSVMGFFLLSSHWRKTKAILKGETWFTREHFLTIRPWEPNFRSTSTNVSSVAVWIGLNELLIEYYNAEALYHIGKTIGNVLRVDTHTTSEARGKFARLCVQINMDKPLITIILIGKFEQPVCYKGIQKLCFDCERMGHQRKNCLYTIRHKPRPREAESQKRRIKGKREYVYAIIVWLAPQGQGRAPARSCIRAYTRACMKVHTGHG